MPSRAWRISKQSAISTAVSRYWRHCPKGGSATDGRSNCNWPAASRCSRPKAIVRPRRPRPMPALASSRTAGRPAPAVHGGLRLWQSANGAGRILDCRRLSNRLQQLARKSGRWRASAGAPQRLGDLMFAGEPAAAREHCEAGRRLYDPERHRSTVCSTAATILAYAPAISVAQPIGCSDIPRRVWRSAAKQWHWLSASLTRLASGMPCCTTRCYTSITASRRWRCGSSTQPRRWLPSNGSVIYGTAVPARRRAERAGSIRGGRRLPAGRACWSARRAAITFLRPRHLAEALARQGRP